MKNVSTFSDETISYSDKNLLWIDAASKKEMISSFIFFIIITCSLFYFCFCGRDKIVTTLYHSHSINFNPDNHYKQNFTYDLSPIYLNMRFVRFSIIFFQNSTCKFDEEFSFNYFIQRLFYNGTHEEAQKNVSIAFHLNPGQHWTNEYILYADFVLDLKFLSVTIFLNTSNTSFKSFELGCFHGNSESTTFGVYYRATFIIIHFLIFVFLIHKFRSNVKKIYYEQYLLFPLLISIIISNNPYCLYRLFYPTSLYYRLMLYAVPITDGMIYFYCEIIFVCYAFRLQEKNDKELSIPENSKSRNLKFKKILICLLIVSFVYVIIILFLNYFLSRYYYFNHFPSYEETQKFKKIKHIKSFIVIIYSFSLLVFELASLIIINIIAPHPFIYLFLGLIFFIQQFLFEGFFVFFDILSEKDENALILSKFIVHNVSCLFFALIHFPVDIREQCSQLNSVIGNAAIDENKVLVIEDINDDLAIDIN